MRGLTVVPFVLALGSLVACSSAPPRQPLLPDPPEPSSPVVVEDAPQGRDDLPRSIRRLVAEQRAELREMGELAERLRDGRGRARAFDEIDRVARELAAIEGQLELAADSDALDDAVLRLSRLATRSALIRDALRGAAL